MKSFQDLCGVAIEKAKQSTGLNQGDLARRLGCTPETLSSLKNRNSKSNKKVGHELISRLAELAGLGEEASHRLRWMWLADAMSRTRYGRACLELKDAIDLLASSSEVRKIEERLLSEYSSGVPGKDRVTNGE